MTVGTETSRSSIPAGPEGDALRWEAAQYPAWQAMHGSPTPADTSPTTRYSIEMATRPLSAEVAAQAALAAQQAGDQILAREASF